MSTLDRTAEFMVRNYSSPVAISTRDTHYLIPRGTPEAPAEFPLTLAEMIYINNTTNVFRVGMLFFDPEQEAELYEALRIGQWRDILRPWEIDDILLHPTTEKLERVIAIQSHQYFDRIYGAYIGLKNAGYPISGSVEKVMTLRRKEFDKGKLHTEIRVKSTDTAAARLDEQSEKLAAMQAQIEALTKALTAKGEAPATADADAADSPAPGKKPGGRGRKKVSGSEKKSGGEQTGGEG